MKKILSVLLASLLLLSTSATAFAMETETNADNWLVSANQHQIIHNAKIAAETGQNVTLTTKILSDLKDANVYTILITNQDGIDDAHIYYVNRKEYVDWAVKVLTVVRSVWSTFSGEGASEWRESVHKEFIKTGITPKDYLDFVCSILHISRKVKIILLDGTVQEAKILDFLDMSYDLTDGRIEESIE